MGLDYKKLEKYYKDFKLLNIILCFCLLFVLMAWVFGTDKMAITINSMQKTIDSKNNPFNCYKWDTTYKYTCLDQKSQFKCCDFLAGECNINFCNPNYTRLTYVDPIQ